MSAIDIKEALSIESSRVLIDAVVEHIISDPLLFDQLYILIFSEKYPVNMRAAWAMMHACKRNPDFFIPYTNNVTLQKCLSHPNNGVRRCCLKIISEYMNFNLLEDKGFILDFGFNIIENPSEAVANKVYAMEIIYKICKNEPDLANEVLILLKTMLEEDQLPGFRSKANKIVKALNKNKFSQYNY